MSNVYPDSVIVTGLMVPTVRVAVIEHMDKLKESLVSDVRCDRFQSAFENLNELERCKAFLLTLDKLIQFDDSEDIAETLFDEV